MGWRIATCNKNSDEDEIFGFDLELQCLISGLSLASKGLLTLWDALCSHFAKSAESASRVIDLAL
jgi:hypothetical protein